MDPSPPSPHLPESSCDAAAVEASYDLWMRADVVSGCGEIMKAALVHDRQLFELMDEHGERLSHLSARARSRFSLSISISLSLSRG